MWGGKGPKTRLEVLGYDLYLSQWPDGQHRSRVGQQPATVLVEDLPPETPARPFLAPSAGGEAEKNHNPRGEASHCKRHGDDWGCV